MGKTCVKFVYPYLTFLRKKMENRLINKTRLVVDRDNFIFWSWDHVWTWDDLGLQSTGPSTLL